MQSNSVLDSDLEDHYILGILQGGPFFNVISLLSSVSLPVKVLFLISVNTLMIKRELDKGADEIDTREILKRGLISMSSACATAFFDSRLFQLAGTGIMTGAKLAYDYSQGSTPKEAVEDVAERSQYLFNSVYSWWRGRNTVSILPTHMNQNPGRKTALHVDTKQQQNDDQGDELGSSSSPEESATPERSPTPVRTPTHHGKRF